MWATGTGRTCGSASRADGWRHFYLVRPRARRLPSDLRNLEMELRGEARQAEAQPAALIALPSPEGPPPESAHTRLSTKRPWAGHMRNRSTRSW